VCLGIWGVWEITIPLFAYSVTIRRTNPYFPLYEIRSGNENIAKQSRNSCITSKTPETIRKESPALYHQQKKKKGKHQPAEMPPHRDKNNGSSHLLPPQHNLLIPPQLLPTPLNSPIKTRLDPPRNLLHRRLHPHQPNEFPDFPPLDPDPIFIAQAREGVRGLGGWACGEGSEG
jgi:hypothetical protein